MTFPNINVKFLSRSSEKDWARQLKNSDPKVGACTFRFDVDETEYDWLVVYDDLPPLNGERRSIRREKLKCNPQNTLLVTTEPSSIKSYFNDYTKQFGHVLTSQPEWALPHRNRIYSQPALQWFYGLFEENTLSYEDIEKPLINQKSKKISTVCSNKQQTHTMHDQRYNFTQKLKTRIDELSVYGKGVNPINDKADAIKEFKYHIVIENYIGDHHITEKIADAFLGESLPFYIGAPNLKDYIPEKSFIQLDINDFEKSTDIIINAINNNEFEKRYEYIVEAKKIFMGSLNIFNTIEKIILERHNTDDYSEERIISSRRYCIDKDIFSRIRHGIQKLNLRINSSKK